MTRTFDPPAVDLRGITVTFPGPVTAVDGVNFKVLQREVVALLGPNGAGKTTLLDVALGLQHPVSGSAELLGLTPQHAIRRGLVGVINQTGALPLDYKVGQLLTMFHGFYDAPLSVEETLGLTHLNTLAGRRIGKLSGGEQQRVRLALALLPDPLVLFLDEPTAGMDPAARQDFWRVMRRAVGRGKTVIFATHYLAEAESFAQRTIIVSDGKVVADAPTPQIMQEGAGELRIDMSAGSFRMVEDALDREEWDYRWQDGTLSVRGRNLDDAARILLDTEGASHLRIADSSLEDTFTAMTSGLHPGVLANWEETGRPLGGKLALAGREPGRPREGANQASREHERSRTDTELEPVGSDAK